MTEAEEFVSVIVPAYSSARFIGRTLKSITAQSHRQIEVIVADDGSTDDTLGHRIGLRAERRAYSLVQTGYRRRASDTELVVAAFPWCLPGALRQR